MPIKLIFRFTWAVLGAIGLSSKSADAAPSATSDTLVQGAVTPTLAHQAATATTGDRQEAPTQEAPTPGQEDDRMIDRIGKMADDQEETNIHDISPEERRRQDEMPRNPKKRMYEAEVKDEL